MGLGNKKWRHSKVWMTLRLTTWHHLIGWILNTLLWQNPGVKLPLYNKTTFDGSVKDFDTCRALVMEPWQHCSKSIIFIWVYDIIRKNIQCHGDNIITTIRYDWDWGMKLILLYKLKGACYIADEIDIYTENNMYMNNVSFWYKRLAGHVTKHWKWHTYMEPSHGSYGVLNHRRATNFSS